MTHNQIAYWNYVESQRANKAREFETARSNRAQEALLGRQHDETARSNRAREVLQGRQNDETYRHNLANEREAIRHNYASEALNSASLNETRRSNRAQESIKWANQNLATNQYFEQQRMNSFNKSIAQQEADAKTLTANTGRTQANINYLNVLRQLRADDYNVLNNAITNLNSLFKPTRITGKGGK